MSKGIVRYPAAVLATGIIGTAKLRGIQKALDEMPKANKFGAVRTQVGEHIFASAKEAARYTQLIMRLKTGEIRNLSMQVDFEVVPVCEISGKKERPVIYRADFVYEEVPSGRQIVEDVKGYKTPEYKIKRKLMKVIHDIDIHEV